MAFNFSECAETNRIYVESFKKVLISMNTYFYEIKLHNKSQSQACGTCSEKKSHITVFQTWRFLFIEGGQKKLNKNYMGFQTFFRTVEFSKHF